MSLKIVKKALFSLSLISMLSFPVMADDEVEIIELESVAEPNSATSNDVDSASESQSNDNVSVEDLASKRLEAEQIISQAYFTLREFEGQSNYEEIKVNLGESRAVLVFPEVLNAGFFIGVGGGTGVLFARSRTGEWSYPTFYTLRQGSIGLQIGADSSRVMMLVMNGKALGGLIDDQFQIGASVKGAAGSSGESIGVSATSNMRRDIMSYAISKGAFIGASFDGASLTPDELLNQAYYGNADATTQSVVIEGQYSNPQSDHFRSYLSQYQYQYD